MKTEQNKGYMMILLAGVLWGSIGLFSTMMTNAGMGVATGENFADALASVSLLGKNGSVLLLANGQKLALLQESVDDFIKPYVKEMEKGYIFGGDNAVSPEIESLLNAAIE